MIDATERFGKIQKAVKARDQFLTEHPELIPLQKQIKKRLSGAGSSENRMVLLGSMMREKLYALSQACLTAKESWS